MGFYRAGSKISLTDRQYDKITEQCESAGLECRIEECWTGSVYIDVWSDSNNHSKKIRLSNHDEGIRCNETTHNAVGTKGEVMKYLNEWLPEIIEWILLPEEEKKELLRKKEEKIEAEKIEQEQYELDRDISWAKEAEEYRKNLTDEEREKIQIDNQKMEESILRAEQEKQRIEECHARGVRRLKVAICLCVLKRAEG
jgi:hypothetical protein